MIDFLINEKIITFALITGVFTTSFLSSIKVNLLDPYFENIFKTDIIDINNNGKLDSVDLKYSNEEIKKFSKQIKFKVFLKDLILWVFVILIVYFFYNFFNSKKI
jgi:hypothetical protein